MNSKCVQKICIYLCTQVALDKSVFNLNGIYIKRTLNKSLAVDRHLQPNETHTKKKYIYIQWGPKLLTALIKMRNNDCIQCIWKVSRPLAFFLILLHYSLILKLSELVFFLITLKHNTP